MNVWVKQTRKRVLCWHCNQYIEVGEFQVVCVYFMKLKHLDKTWTKAMHFHAKEPYCWIDRAVVEVGMRPVSESRGRKSDPINDETKALRQKILRRHGSVMQRMGAEISGLCRPSKLLHLTELLEKLAMEIEPLGGVPESWRT